MRLANLAAATSALMLIASPALAASANPAAKLSVASSDSVRAGAKIKNGSNLSPVLGVVAAIVALGGIGIAAGVFDSGNDDPDSN